MQGQNSDAAKGKRTLADDLEKLVKGLEAPEMRRLVQKLVKTLKTAYEERYALMRR